MWPQAKERKQKLLWTDAEGKGIIINYLVWTPNTNANGLKNKEPSHDPSGFTKQTVRKQGRNPLI